MGCWHDVLLVNHLSLFLMVCVCLQPGTHLQPGSGCVPCHCNSFGSKSFDCSESGQCRCQPGVTGQKCDRCAPGHFNFQEGGCTRKTPDLFSFTFQELLQNKWYIWCFKYTQRLTDVYIHTLKHTQVDYITIYVLEDAPAF